MGRFVQGEDRRQDYLLPASLNDYVSEDNPVRAIEAFIDALDLKALEFAGMTPAETGRPAYHPAMMLKIYLYGYLNRVQSSRRLEREAQRNIELMWLTGRLAPDFKTIANFRRANGAAIRSVCSQFIVLCRQLGLFTRAVVAIDGSKMKAVNNRDKNYTAAKVASRMKQVQDNIDRYLDALDRADREESDIAEPKAKPDGEDRPVACAAAGPGGARRGSPECTEPAGVADRSGRARHGERGPWDKHRRLQSPSGRRR